MFLFLLVLIFLRPFICSLAYPDLDNWYSLFFLLFFLFWSLRKGLRTLLVRPLVYPLGAFLLTLALPVIFSQKLFSSLIGINQYLIGIALLIVVSNMNPGEKKQFMRVLIIIGVSISVLAIYQYFFSFTVTKEYVMRHHISSAFVLDYIQRKRAFFPFVTPNALAGYLAMILLLALGIKEIKWSIVPLAIAFFLTQSFGGFLSFLVALILYFHLKGTIKKRHIILISTACIISFGFILTRILTSQKHENPIFSILMRLDYWKDTLYIITRHPLVGVGIDNFTLSRTLFTHNSYLQLWAEMGILSLVSFIWLMIALFKQSVHNIRNSQHADEFAGVTAALAVFLIHNLFDFTFFLPEVSLIWWGIAGIAASADPFTQK